MSDMLIQHVVHASACSCDSALTSVQVRESLVAGIPAVVGRDVPALNAQVSNLQL